MREDVEQGSHNISSLSTCVYKAIFIGGGGGGGGGGGNKMRYCGPPAHSVCRQRLMKVEQCYEICS